MPLPITHAFVGATIAEMLLPTSVPRRKLKVFAFGCLAVTPDLDFIPVWFSGLARDWHRGFSHSLVAAISISSLALFARSTTRVREMAICALAVASHGFLDAVTTSDGNGVELLWPFSSYRVKFGLIDVWELSPDWVGAGEIAHAFQSSLLELLLLGPLFLGIAWLHRRTAFRANRS